MVQNTCLCKIKHDILAIQRNFHPGNVGDTENCGAYTEYKLAQLGRNEKPIIRYVVLQYILKLESDSSCCESPIHNEQAIWKITEAP